MLNPSTSRTYSARQRLGIVAMLVVTACVYWPGLSGGFMFDDFPNIVENSRLFPSSLTLQSLADAATSSPASEFRRPLASLSFTLGSIVSAPSPHSMKLGNLLIHLLNGLLLLGLSRRLITALPGIDSTRDDQANGIAILVAASWMLLPVNVSSVLYVVQRMESLANLCVLAGLIGYVNGRQRMLNQSAGSLRCAVALMAGSAIGLGCKESALLLPVYALLLEWMIFHFRDASGRVDRRIVALFVVLLLFPLLVGLYWLIPRVTAPEVWQFRGFSLHERLLTEARVVVSYAQWTLLPKPGDISFFHDDTTVSAGWLHPATTAASIALLGIAAVAVIRLRVTRPLVALGIGFFLAAQLMTATIIPLELAFEHRNYFASAGLLLATIPMLWPDGNLLRVARYALIASLATWWVLLLSFTVHAWSNPLRFAREMSIRAPNSPRAQYEFATQLIGLSHYDAASPLLGEARQRLAAAAAMPNSSALADQGLVVLDARLNQPQNTSTWDSLDRKLARRPPGPQDIAALTNLVVCARRADCVLPRDRLEQAFRIALNHPHPSGYLMRVLGDYVLASSGDVPRALQWFRRGKEAAPEDPDQWSTLVRALLLSGNINEARSVYAQIPAKQRRMLGTSVMQRLSDCLTVEPTQSECPMD